VNRFSQKLVRVHPSSLTRQPEEHAAQGQCQVYERQGEEEKKTMDGSSKCVCGEQIKSRVCLRSLVVPRGTSEASRRRERDHGPGRLLDRTVWDQRPQRHGNVKDNFKHQTLQPQDSTSYMWTMLTRPAP